MQVIKNKKLIENVWYHVADDGAVDAGNITVSLARWRKDKNQLAARKNLLGIRIQPDDNVANIADDLSHFQLVELVFPDFADGRLFSHAWLLRNRYAYSGELRATGNYMSDQVFYLSRVGVNAFQPNNPAHLTIELAYLNDFSVHYQNQLLTTGNVCNARWAIGFNAIVHYC